MFNIQFDHSKGNLMQSMGITEDDFKTAKARILFHTISRPFIVEDLYDIHALDEDEIEDVVPAELRTGSGVLEKCINTAVSDTEKLAIVFMFHDQHKSASEMMAMYLAYTDTDKVEELIHAKFGTGIKAILAMAVFKERVSHMKELKEIFEYVKAANGSFDIFKSLIPDGQYAIDFLTDGLERILEKLNADKKRMQENEDEDDD